MQPKQANLALNENGIGDDNVAQIKEVSTTDDVRNALKPLLKILNLAPELRPEVLRQLEEVLGISILKGMIPICANCKDIRDETGAWRKLEYYLEDHSEAVLSHGICTCCCTKLYPDLDLSDDLDI